MGSGAYVSSGGTWTNASSREVKERIEALSAEDAQAAVAALSPVTFNYKSSPEEKQVGFIAEDVPELVATQDRKGLSPMDIVAVLTKVVQTQQQALGEQQHKQEAQQTLIEKQQQTIEQLTALARQTAEQMAILAKEVAVVKASVTPAQSARPQTASVSLEMND